jgi:hypothetical protein
MKCEILRLCDLDDIDKFFIVDFVCKAKSDFRTKLIDKELTSADGWISIVRDQGEIVGWCRTEKWADRDSGEVWDTMEAFVRDEWRRRGVCQFAAAGLMAAVMPAIVPPVAIFSPSMIQTCRRLAIKFVEYERGREGWMKSRY